jgi:hypothetical protein
MNFLDLNDDVKSIITTHITIESFISTMFLCQNITTYKKNYLVRSDLITIFVRKIQDDVKDDDDFNSSKIYMIYRDINDVSYIGSTCFSLKKCLSSLKKNQNQDVIGIGKMIN